jgi:hypothetical protein
MSNDFEVSGKIFKHAYNIGRYDSVVSQENLESVKHCFNYFHE